MVPILDFLVMETGRISCRVKYEGWTLKVVSMTSLSSVRIQTNLRVLPTWCPSVARIGLLPLGGGKKVGAARVLAVERTGNYNTSPLRLFPNLQYFNLPLLPLGREDTHAFFGQSEFHRRSRLRLAEAPQVGAREARAATTGRKGGGVIARGCNDVQRSEVPVVGCFPRWRRPRGRVGPAARRSVRPQCVRTYQPSGSGPQRSAATLFHKSVRKRFVKWRCICG